MRTHYFAIAFLCLINALPMPAVTFERDGGTIRAKDGDSILWENRHHYWKPYDLKSSGTAEIVTANGFIYYVIGTRILYEVDDQNGIVKRRFTLPGKIAKLLPSDGFLQIDVGRTGNWSRHYSISPNSSTIPFFMSDHFLEFSIPKNQAHNHLKWYLKRFTSTQNAETPSKIDVDATSQLSSDFDTIRKNVEVYRPHLETAVTELGDLARRDLTNPWYYFYQGQYLQLLGRSDEARAAYQNAISCPEPYRYEVARMAYMLDNDFPDLGDAAFKTALESMIKNGYEPESHRALITLMLYYGSRENSDSKPLEYKNKLGERLWDFAPYCEASAFVYNALYEENKSAGNASYADVWKKRRDTAEPYLLFGIPETSFLRAGDALTLCLAAILAIVIYSLSKFFYYAPEYRKARKAKTGSWNFFAYWTSSERINLAYLIILGIIFAHLSSVYFGRIAISAGLPLAAINGDIGHPDGLARFECASATDSGRFYQAICLQSERRLEEADALYSQINSSKALNNRGTIARQKGDEKLAVDFFQQALSMESDLPEARANLGQSTPSPRIERLKRYNFNGPFISILDSTQYIDLFSTICKIENSGLGSIRGILVLHDDSAVSVFDFLAYLVFILLAATPVLVHSFFIRRQNSVNKGSFGLTHVIMKIEYLLPGVSNRWSYSGGLIFLLFITSIILSFLLRSSMTGATNIIDAIGLPNVGRAYGLFKPYRFGSSAFLYSIRHLWLILLLANIIIKLVVGVSKSDQIIVAIPSETSAAKPSSNDTEGK